MGLLIRTGAASRRGRPGDVKKWFELNLANVGGLQPLGSASHVELEGLTLGQRLEPFALNRGEMHEDVFAVLLGDEAETLRFVEPLHGATSHLQLLADGQTPCINAAPDRGGHQPVEQHRCLRSREAANEKPPERPWRY